MINFFITNDDCKITFNGKTASVEDIKALIKPGTSEDIEKRIEDAFETLRKHDLIFNTPLPKMTTLAEMREREMRREEK